MIQADGVRVAILWKQLSGYARASFLALASEGVDILVVSRAAQPDAPFDDAQLATGLPGYQWDDAPGEDRLRREIEAFSPDALLVISWDVTGYRRVARSMAGRTLRVLCMDNPWRGTPKQWAGRLVSPLLIRPTYDAAFVTGERQAAFARRLGLPDDRILWGLYTCDHDAFSEVADRSRNALRPRRFIFVGRLAAEKGVDALARAYRLYRDSVPDPWPMLVCGTGPLAAALGAVPGVELRGFVQPADLPDAFAEASCLVLPSTFEPWGVVIHEATAAGLTVICTSACGAGTRLVLDGYNGVVVTPGDATGLSRAMARIAAADDSTRAEMSRRSVELAGQFTPSRWATYLVERIPQLREMIGLRP